MQHLIIAWCVLGVAAILVNAIIGILPFVHEARGMELSAPHLGFAALWIAFMAYTEGYRGFQKRFCPRVVSRAWHLGSDPHPVRVLLGPLYAMGFFHATRKRKIIAWSLTIGIVMIVLVVKLVPQPWRGIVDLGVVIGLSWGTIALAVEWTKALKNGGTDVDPQLPDPATGD